jgi:hypothetical protein
VIEYGITPTTSLLIILSDRVSGGTGTVNLIRKMFDEGWRAFGDSWHS